MKIVQEGVINQAFELAALYKILKKLSTPFEDTKAFELGIINNRGRILKKRNQLKTPEEKEALTRLDVFVFNIKRLLPFGNSRLLTLAGGLFLLKESENLKEHSLFELEEKFQKFLDEDSDTQQLTNILGDNFEFNCEEIANAVGGGQVAGTVGEPPGKSGVLLTRHKKKKKKKKKDRK
jgi:hypothetical protein